MSYGWVRAPAVHFVVLGGLLFGAERAWHAASRVGVPPAVARPEQEEAARRERQPIVVSAARLRQIQETFVQQNGEPPTPAQLEGLVRQAIDEELLEREARWLALDLGDRGIRQRLVGKMRAVSRDPGLSEAELYRAALDLGLDDDVAVRQHLRHKMRLLLQQAPDGRPPTDEELAACLERHREQFLRPTAVDFTHVFVSARIDPDHLAERAAELAEQLRELPPEQAAELSDPFPLATRWDGRNRDGIARHFGDELADAVMTLPAATWSAPLASPFGLHLVWVHARHAEEEPPLDSVRVQLVQIVYEERATARLAAGLDRLRRLYQIRIEWPREVASTDSAATEARR